MLKKQQKQPEEMIEIKEEKREVEETPVIIETVQSNIFNTKIKEEYEENYEFTIPDDDEYGEVEFLDEYIEEVKNMSPMKVKEEFKIKTEIKEEPNIKEEPSNNENKQPKMNLRGVKINLAQMLGTKPSIKKKLTQESISAVCPQIDVPNCFNTSERPFRCKKCPLSFKFRRDLTNHRAIHKKADFWCRKCHQKFRFQASFLSHDCDFWCNICGKVISNKANLKIHLSYVHGIGDAKLFHCDMCGNTYKSKRNIDTHMKNHMKSTPFNCAICGKGFSHAGALKIHMWNHRDLVHCEYCNRKFKPRSLYYHIKRCKQQYDEQENTIITEQKIIQIENMKYQVVQPQPVFLIKIKNQMHQKRV